MGVMSVRGRQLSWALKEWSKQGITWAAVFILALLWNDKLTEIEEYQVNPILYLVILSNGIQESEC